MKKLLLLASLCIGSQFGHAQAATNSPMAKLTFLEGSWHGSAWVNLGPNDSKTIEQKEIVTSMLNNQILHVVGIGTEKGKIVFEALGILSFNKSTEKYNFRAYRENGLSTDAYVELKGDKWFEWGFNLPNGGKMRYNTKLTVAGQWNEVGEYSPDGTKWYKNFEMTLDRDK